MNIIDNQEQALNTKPLPQLIKKSDTYKLIVPAKVEEKIRYLLRKFPSTEWSGVLFTSHTGSFEKKNLVITCEDIYPMDLGTTTFTDFQMNADVASYMAQNMELFDYDLQLIHSHHSMPAFFSGTDTHTLQEEGNERNCFVSLIVNNEGTYCAAVTRKIQTKSEINVKVLGTSYEFFGDGPVHCTPSSKENKQTVDKEFIEYFMLDVQREIVDNHLAFLDTRFDEIIERKKDTQKKTTTDSILNSFSGCDPWNSKEHTGRYLFDDATMNDLKVESKEELFPDEDLDNYIPDDKLIKDSVYKMLLLSLNTNTEGLDMKQWIKRHMKNVYDRVFPDTDEQYPSFEAWCDFIVEFMVEHFKDPRFTEIYDLDYYHAIIAESMSNVLRPYKEENDYIQAYLDRLEMYINF